ncbi:hypothetical protein ULG90_09345 [Halopseudomonas pachastrellae]|nr:hypothetical protein ULG90_09345 [Halopseudomonas pachastrellae]
MERAATFCTGDLIELSNLPDRLQQAEQHNPGSPACRCWMG